jgi:hypothetical protein
MTYLIMTGTIWLLAIVFAFVILSARYRKTYIIRHWLIVRFSMEKRKRFENKLTEAFLGGYRVIRCKGYIGKKEMPYNFHVEVK